MKILYATADFFSQTLCKYGKQGEAFFQSNSSLINLFTKKISFLVTKYVFYLKQCKCTCSRLKLNCIQYCFDPISIIGQIRRISAILGFFLMRKFETRFKTSKSEYLNIKSDIEGC